MLPHIEACSYCCAICGHTAHVGVCGRGWTGIDDCDCEHSIPKLVSV